MPKFVVQFVHGIANVLVEFYILDTVFAGLRSRCYFADSVAVLQVEKQLSVEIAERGEIWPPSELLQREVSDYLECWRNVRFLLDTHDGSRLLVCRYNFNILAHWLGRLNNNLLDIWNASGLGVLPAWRLVVHSDDHHLLAGVHTLSHHELEHVHSKRLRLEQS